jgi:hypothetical protein
MSFLASLLGSGVGAVTIAVAVLLERHYRHLPGQAHPWAERLMIILMYAGGSAIAVTDAGQWADKGITWAAGLLGGLDSGIPRAALIIACMFTLAALVVALVFAPSSRSAYLAAGMPVILALVAGGFLHQVYLTTTAPAQHLASALTSWLGG